MRTPNWTDGIYINAALINPAFADATKAATESASVWAIPGLVHPEVVTWGAAGLTVSGTMPPPFSLLCASGGVSGLVANAHGVVDGQDSQSFSVNLAPLVPVSGPSITAYIYAASGIISQTPTTIVGPPQGNPAYNPNFVPFVSYTEQVATVVVSAAAAVPTGGFVLASIPLASGQSSISVASLSFAGQDLAAVAPTVAFQNLSGSNILTLSQAGFALMVESSATTQTLPPANTANGRVFRVIAGFVSGTATVAANGSDLIYGFSNTGVGQGSISLPPGSRVALVGNGSGWLLESHSGLLPISWDFLGTPPAPISITPGGVTLPYPSTIDGSGSGDALTVSDPTNTSQGAGILLKGNGPTTPNKSLQAKNGQLVVSSSTGAAQIMSLDDSGNLSTAGNIVSEGSVSAIGPLLPNGFANIAYYTGSNSFTVPIGVTRLRLHLWGGGGSGGGGGTPGNGPGSGGGSGAMVCAIVAVSGGQVIDFTVGVGGGAVSPGINGVAGGATTIPVFNLIAGPGGGGSGGNVVDFAGGTGGNGSGGQFMINGAQGFVAAIGSTGTTGGSGASSPLGGGGGKGSTGLAGAGTVPGGGGAGGGPASPFYPSANGANGAVLIEW